VTAFFIISYNLFEQLTNICTVDKIMFVGSNIDTPKRIRVILVNDKNTEILKLSESHPARNFKSFKSFMGNSY